VCHWIRSKTAPRKLGMVAQHTASNSTHSALQRYSLVAPLQLLETRSRHDDVWKYSWLALCANSPSILLEHDSIASQRSRILPDDFWRTFYEDSHACSCYVSNERGMNASSLGVYMDTVRNQVNDDDAFQAPKRFIPGDDISKENIEEHLNWES
jgi:hypothetical protein